MQQRQQIRKIDAPEIGEYKGNPILSIPTAKGYPFSFGVAKARAILAHLEDIKNFVEMTEH